jgi:predicted DNA-binding transcriptional regulator AlpA
MTKQLLKRADVLEWTGLTPDQFYKMVDAKVLKPIRLRGYKIMWFKRSEVAQALQLDIKP